MSKTLQLSLKKKWFDMTNPNGKTEDYREINEYWFKRLFRNVDKKEMSNILIGLKQGRSIEWAGLFHLHYLKEFEFNKMTLGYPKSTDKSRIKEFEHKGIEIRTGKKEWGAEPGKLYFVIKHGTII